MNLKRMSTGAALCLALLAFASAQDDSSALFAAQAESAAASSATTAAAASPGSAAADSAGFDLQLSGSHEFDYHLPAYSDDWNYQGEMKSPAFRNELGATVKDGRVKIVSAWDLDLLPDQSGDQNQLGDWNTLARARPMENYVSWSPSAFKLAFGYQIYSWGVADKMNPTDNLNPRDYTTGVNADKIPVLSADLVWYPSDSLSVEGVCIPYEQPDKWPVDFAGEITSSALSALGATSSTLSYASLAYDPSSWVGGGKLSYHSAGLDASASYLYDLDSFYTPVITVSSAAPYYITSISLERKRIHRFGADAKTTLGKFGLWCEGAYSLTGNSGSADYSVRKSRLDYVAGFDFNYGPNDSYYVNIQYVGAWIPGYDASYGRDYAGLAGGALVTELMSDRAYMTEYYERSLVNGLGLETEGLVQGATIDLKWELAGGTFTPQLTGVVAVPFKYDDSSITRYASLALNPEIDFMPIDSFHIKLGADLAYSWYKNADGDLVLDTATDKIGIYTTSNNVYLTVLYKWSYDLVR